jgi:hypothetical protein
MVPWVGNRSIDYNESMTEIASLIKKNHALSRQIAV